MARNGPNGKCATCIHPERHRIELLLAGGASIRAVATKFGVDYHCVRRHFRQHVSDERRAMLIAGPMRLIDLAERAADEGSGLLDHFKALRNVLYDQIAAAAEAGDRAHVAQLSGRAIEALREMARLGGELAKGGVTINNNFFMHPTFAELQAMLVSVLREFPEARAAVIRGLRDLEVKASSLQRAHLPLIEGSAAEVRDDGARAAQ